jgi:phosphoglycolate phosphatase-like HAD superfamily hydrolase
MSVSDPKPPEQSVTAILLDVDGTLVDTYKLYLEAYRRALEPYLGYMPSIEEFIARQPSSERHFLADWVGAEDAAACRAEMARHYEELHDALCGGMYEGVREMLQGLRSAGIPLGVVTGKGRRAWEVTAASTGLGEFEVVITDDDIESAKPHRSRPFDDRLYRRLDRRPGSGQGRRDEDRDGALAENHT